MTDAQTGSNPLMSPIVAQRQRAPTITIDTSARDQESLPSSDAPTQPQRVPSTQSSPLPSLNSIQVPPSSHNLSPTLRSSSTSQDSQQLLAIPDSRSRGSSIDGPYSVSSYGGETLRHTSATSEYGGSQWPPSEISPFTELEYNHNPLKMDPGEEHLYHVEDNPFEFSPGHLSKLFNPKSISVFRAVGGLQGLVQGLRTDSCSGLSLDETNLDEFIPFDDYTEPTGSDALHNRTLSMDSNRPLISSRVRATSSEPYVDRRRVFGDSRLPEKKTKSILQIMWMTFNDKVLIILTVVAAISLTLGLYQDYEQPDNGPKVRWVEGATIMFAVMLVVVVGSVNDFQKERQFIKLNKTKDDRMVNAIRSGRSMKISVYDILAGDVLYIEAGDLVPADGIFISGHNVLCDESSVTGESDQMKKIPGDEVMSHIEAGANVNKLDPFIISGSKVLEGIGTYLVTSVGVHSSHGRLMMGLRSETDPTPLQTKLNILAEQISKLGCAVALLLFITLFVRFLCQLKGNPGTPSEKGQEFLQIVIVSITIIVIAVPEGLPLAVTLALAFAVTRMLKDNNLVRMLRACEAMGNVNNICTDKTGTLTLNKMIVVAGTLSTGFRFADSQDILDRDQEGSEGDAATVPISILASHISTEVRELLLQSIAINSTAFESRENGIQGFVGSKTETALLHFASTYLAMGPVNEERANIEVVQMVPFDSRRKCMASVIKLSDSHYRMLVKGAPEILLRHCTQVITGIAEPLKITDMTSSNLNSLNDTIDMYASRSLRTMGIVYRDFSYWPPPEAKLIGDDAMEASFEDVFQDMVFLGVVGIRDPVRPGVKEAVAQCQHAGVCVRMVTGDNIKTAVAVAQECGIYTQGGGIMEGPEFRKLSSLQMAGIIPNLQVLARSSPEDKRILVTRLKDLGATVAVTGDGTNDGPALKTADVGFSMGIAGTEVAKEASSIVLMDDNFASIVKALQWGRTINDAVKKFLQFQITVNITAVILTFVSAIASNKEEPILTPVQLLWVNLIMDTFAALALATDPPAPSILDRKPDPRSAPLITLTMWKMIVGQSIYQLAVTLTLNFGGNRILGYTIEEDNNLETLIFNVYVWMQFFNQYNNRRLDNKFNIFEGIHRNWFFIAINLIMVTGQLLIVSVGGEALSTKPLDSVQWGISLALGAISLVVGIIVRLVPDELIRKLIHKYFQRTHAPYITINSDPRFEWNDTIENVRDELAFFKTIRGRRFNGFFSSNSASVADETPSPTTSPIRGGGRSRSNTALAPATVMAGVIAGSIAGWSPREIGSADVSLNDAP